MDRVIRGSSGSLYCYLIESKKMKQRLKEQVEDATIKARGADNPGSKTPTEPAGGNPTPPVPKELLLPWEAKRGLLWGLPATAWMIIWRPGKAFSRPANCDEGDLPFFVIFIWLVVVLGGTIYEYFIRLYLGNWGDNFVAIVGYSEQLFGDREGVWGWLKVTTYSLLSLFMSFVYLVGWLLIWLEKIGANKFSSLSPRAVMRMSCYAFANCLWLLIPKIGWSLGLVFYGRTFYAWLRLHVAANRIEGILLAVMFTALPAVAFLFMVYYGTE